MSGIIGLSPDMRSGVVGQKVNNRPAFSAYYTANVAVGTGGEGYRVGSGGETWTEIYDTNSKFDVSSGYFTPTIPGHYFVYFGCRMQTGITSTRFAVMIFKNDALATSQEMETTKLTSSSYAGVSISSVLYLDHNDKVAGHAFQNSGGDRNCYDFNCHGFRVG